MAEVGGGQYKADSVGMYYDMFRRTYERASSQFGAKPLVTAEFNTDGDVTGARHQGESVIRFAEAFRDHQADWFKAISLYQFRDRGRLGRNCAGAARRMPTAWRFRCTSRAIRNSAK